MAARFVLHGFFRSGPTYKVALALSLSGEPYAYESIALREGQHKTPAFLAKNRYGLSGDLPLAWEPFYQAFSQRVSE